MLHMLKHQKRAEYIHGNHYCCISKECIQLLGRITCCFSPWQESDWVHLSKYLDVNSALCGCGGEYVVGPHVQANPTYEG
mmetsp:Transcript_79561/g.132862  ORF Transcript_79561/g.132862 Transcript_79561/m.132862 type:complete len:80 (-) Transcript_79561:14-253(-)